MANASICKQCAMQRILKSAKKWVSYGLFTYFLRHTILQVYKGLIFQARVMKLVLNFKKRLLQLLQKGHLDISQLEAELWTFFDEILRNCQKQPFLHVFWQVFGYGQKSFYTTNFILLLLTFQIICNVCCKGERYPLTGLVIVFSWKFPIFWNFPKKL